MSMECTTPTSNDSSPEKCATVTSWCDENANNVITSPFQDGSYDPLNSNAHHHIYTSPQQHHNHHQTEFPSNDDLMSPTTHNRWDQGFSPYPYTAPVGHHITSVPGNGNYHLAPTPTDDDVFSPVTYISYSDDQESPIAAASRRGAPYTDLLLENDRNIFNFYSPPSSAHTTSCSAATFATSAPYTGAHLHNQRVAAGISMAPSRPPVVRKRNTANKKERKRTQSINNAFAELRDCIPNVPTDTKLSKIKTLRLATSYIAYLMDLLSNGDEPFFGPDSSSAGFNAAPVIDLCSLSSSDGGESGCGNCDHPEGRAFMEDVEYRGNKADHQNSKILPMNEFTCEQEYKKLSGNGSSTGVRTGWPQHEWAVGLKQQQ